MKKSDGRSGTIRLRTMIGLLEGLAATPFLPPRRRNRFLRSAEKRRRKLDLLIGVQQGSVAEDRQENSTSLHTRTRDGLQTDIPPSQAPGRILVVCLHAPTVSHAGGLRILDMLHKIKTKHPRAHVEIFTSAKVDLYGPMSEALQIADRVVVAPNYDFSLAEYIRQTPCVRTFDIVDFQFPQPVEILKEYRKIGRKLIFTPMESHIRNEVISRGEPCLSIADLKTSDALLESSLCQIVDQTVCVSQADRDAIRACVPGDIIAIETGVSQLEFSGHVAPVAPGERAVCFVAYFGSETNREALRWYLNHVHPRVVRDVPDYEFRIIGRGDITDILANPIDNLRYIGEVDRVAPHIAAAAVGIAPALSGSGFRGKINQYAQMRVPTVASGLAAEGLAYTHGESIFVANDPEDFAASIVQLLQEPRTRAKMASAAAAICHDVYGWDSRWALIAEVYDLPPTPDVLALPSVHAIVPSFRHAAFIQQRLRSVFAQEYAKIRVTVIDDHSLDGSHEIIESLRQEHEFEYIRRERNSGSPFSAWRYAAENTSEDLIWICESDDSCDPLMVGRLVHHLSARRSAKMAYCASVLLDDRGEIVGSTDDYFSEVFHPTRWQHGFIARGQTELKQYQRFGMVVPNMSSLLIDADVFRAAFDADVQRYRLAGDWLFVGRALQFGDIVYLPERLNHFRKHESTARAQTLEPRRLAEHASVRLKLSELAGASKIETLAAVKHDLRELIADKGIARAALNEMETFDAGGAQRLRSLLSEFAPDGKAAPQLVELFA